MKDVVEIDGTTGEGGGQLVRNAVAIASVIGQAIRITDVRGNREGPRGGGLKSQHVSAVTWLAQATAAETSGLYVGSHTLEFRPTRKPWDLESRNIKIAADSSAASTLLIFQAIFPFLLFASNEKGDPIKVTISGGTNVSFSLSYEYLDQVLLPTLERTFGIRVERRLESRGWSLGKITRGTIAFRIHPQKPEEPLRLLQPESDYTEEDLDVVAVDVSIVAPSNMHEDLQECLVQDLGDFFPGADVAFPVCEDSGDDSRVYVLLVAKSEAGPIWGRDHLTSVPKKTRGKGGSSAGAKATASVSENIARKVSKELFAEVSSGGVVDEFLQDQLIIFQALAEGRSSFPRSGPAPNGDLAAIFSLNNGVPKTSSKNGFAESMQVANNRSNGSGSGAANLVTALDGLEISDTEKRDRTRMPFGEGSTHTKTARWVIAQLLPGVKFFNRGRICEGVGMQSEKKLLEQQLLAS